MMRFILVIALTCGVAVAQNSNSSTTTERHRTTNTNGTKPLATTTQKAPTSTPKPSAKKPPVFAQQASGAEGVLAAFNSLLDGIRHASVNEVMNVYWNSSQLNLF